MSGCAAVGCSNRGDKGFFMKSFPRDPDRRALWALQMKRDSWQPNNNSRLCEVHFDNDQWEKTRQDGTRKLKCNAVPTLFQHSKQIPKRKGQKRKFNVTVKADEVLASGMVSGDKSKASATIEKSIENNKRRTVGRERKKENDTSLGMNEKIKSKIRKVSMNFAKQQNLTFQEENKSQPEFQRCLSKSNFTSETKRLWCSAANCSSWHEANWSKSSFYKFPLGDSVLLKKWLQICNEDFKPSTQSVICRKHFPLDCFNIDDSSVLKNSAVPTLYNECDRDEARSIDLEEIIEDKAYRSSNLCRNWELSDTMSEVEMTKLQDTCCRLCASSDGKNYIPIFGKSDLAEKISRCLPIIVLPTDNLPSYVCQQCLYNLNISYKLIIGSIRADSFLRAKFVKTLTSHESEEPAETQSKQSNDNYFMTKEETIFKINGPIKCDLCDDFFQDMNIFDMHIETTHLLQWRCSLCDHSFETSQELVVHKTLNHFGQISTCRNCINGNSVDELDLKATEAVENCTNTDVNLSLNRSLDNGSEAREVETKLTDLNCTICKIVFDNAKQFRKHHVIHLPRRLKCSVCYKRCPSIFDHLTHNRIVHNQIRRNKLGKRNTVHSCKYCKKVFIIKQQLIIHLRKHTKEMFDDPSVAIYKCVTCPKKFVDRALYQKHRNIHDPACWHKFRCYICSRSFMDKFKLKLHQSIHDGVKPYQCDVCGRMFNRNANMIRHRAKHFEQTCRHCQKSFANTRSLRDHLKDIHGDTLISKTNSKATKGGKGDVSNDNFICRYCGKQLTSYHSLLDHERIHTGDRPYICENCGKAFRSITARWDHMVRHEKGNYICELCGKIMSNKLNLRRHLRKHVAIEQRRFECKECGKLFHVRWRLNVHLIRIHHSGPSV